MIQLNEYKTIPDDLYSGLENAVRNVAKNLQIEEEKLKINPYFFPQEGISPILAVLNYIPDSQERIIDINCEFLVRQNFFELFSPLQQEAAIAHEIGHYKRNKRKIKKCIDVYQNKDWIKQYHGKKPRKHSLERLEKWFLLTELNADNEAFESGYGRPLIEVLSILLENFPFNEAGIKEIKYRIANLGSKLWE